MSEGDQPFFIMGLPLYMDYYTVHDDDNNRIGFAPKTGSSKSTLITGTKPERIFESLSPNDYPVSDYSWYASATIMFLFILTWCFVILSTLKNRGGKVDLGSMVVVAVAFIIVFGALIYFIIQPWINEKIIENGWDSSIPSYL